MISKILRFCLILKVILITVNCDDSKLNVYKTVQTNSGTVRGRLNQTLLNQKDYFAYKGIPFAKPPLRELRFKAPQPVEPWSNTLDAFEFAPACPQLDDEIMFRDTREDCLFLNIFVPAVNETKKFPVLIFVFGGAFTKGTADDTIHGADFLLERGIIYVSISYRLGVLGFMSLGTPEMSGNMGLKDQQLALKWIYENIESFGGDNTQITLSGHSAGSISIGHHFLHPETQNYFQQILFMSATAITSTSYENGDHRCLMELLASFTKRVETTEQLVEFLQNAPVEEFMRLTSVTRSPVDPIWAPIVERENAINPYIPRDPLEHLESLPSINKTAYFTFTNREVLSFAPPGFPQMEMIDDFLDDFEILLPIHGYYAAMSKKSYLKDLMDEVYDYYFANATTDFEKSDQVVVLLSDLLVLYSIEEWLIKHVAISQKNTYYQRFSVDSLLNAAKEVDFPGAGHDDEACYLFNCREFNDYYKQINQIKFLDEKNATTIRTMNYMTKLVSNFVKYGNPSVNGNPIKGFEPVNAKEINFLDVTNDGLVVGKSPNGDRIKFLQYIVKESQRRVNEHGDTPTQTDPDRRCIELKEMDKVSSWFLVIVSLKYFAVLTILSIIIATLTMYLLKKFRGHEEQVKLMEF